MSLLARTFLLMTFFVTSLAWTQIPSEAFTYHAVAQDPLSSGALTFQELSAALLNPSFPLTDVDSVLSYLKRRDPAALDYPVLMFESLSSQADAVSPKYPRVLFQKDRLIFAVTTNPRHPKFQQMEVIEYNPVAYRFEFHRLEFTPGKAAAIEGDRECRRCHGNDLRPLWGSYAMWPGAYGQTSDDLAFARPDTMGLELTDYLLYLQDAPASRRLSFFPAVQRMPTKFFNTEFTSRLSALNFHRIRGRLETSPLYPKYKFAIAGVLQECANLESFLPPLVKAAHEKRLGMTLQGIVEDTLHRAERDFYEKRLRILAMRAVNPSVEPWVHFGFSDDDRDQYPTVGALRFVLEGQSIDPSLDFKAWSLNAPPGRTSFSYGFSTPAQAVQDLREFHFRERWALDPDFGSSDPRCEDLRKKSLAALAE